MVGTITKQVPQTLTYYWGADGEYGPFDVQQEGPWAGWPNFGQVMRYFRKKAKLSGPEFGELYGKTVNADRSAFGKRWIYDMETNNLGPVDIGRRKIIAELLGIPPMLFGLAVLEDITLSREEKTSHLQGDGQSTLKRVSTDLDRHQADIRLRWKLYATSDASDTLADIKLDLQQLERLVTQAKGDFLYHIQNLLFSNYFLASLMAENKGQFDKQYSHANEMVRVANAMSFDPELVATALYARACARLYWGLYGTVNERGIFVVDHKLLNDAKRDFEKAKEGAHPQLEGVILAKLSRAQAHLGMRNTPVSNLDLAANLIGVNDISDPYTRTLVTGTYGGFHEGRYRARRIETLNVLGAPTKALTEITALRKLNENTYGRDETRRFAWIDILEAEARLQMDDFYAVTDCAKKALRVFLDLHIVNNIAIIRDLYGRLLSSPYAKSEDVEELGEMLGQEKTL